MKKCGLILILVVVAVSCEDAMAARKALVIGIGDYQHFEDLSTPTNDASQFAKTLATFGFDVRVPKNTDINGIKHAQEQFLQSLTKKDEALYFFSGHGLQRGQDNFLLAADSNIDETTSIGSLNDHTINVTFLLTEMESRAKLAILFLDACRTIQTPGSKSPFGGVKGGFTFKNVHLIQGPASFVGFASQENTPAFTGHGTVSPYTNGLLRALKNSELAREPLPQLYAHVTRMVKNETNQAQIPDYRHALGGREFRFTNVPPAAITPANSKYDVTKPLIRPEQIVFEATNRTVVITQTLPLRESATITARLAGDVQEGQELHALARTQKRDWYQLRMGQNIAYLQSRFLKELQPAKATMIAIKSVPLRRSPSPTATVEKTIQEGQELRVLGRAEDWYKVRAGDDIGYLHSGFLQEWNATALSAIIVATKTVPWYRIPDFAATPAGEVQEGLEVKVSAESTNWYQARVGPDMAYLQKDFFRKWNAEQSSRTMVATRKTSLYRSPVLTASIAGAINDGQKIRVLAQAKEWFQVDINERLAYVRVDHLRELKCRAVYGSRLKKIRKTLRTDDWQEGWTRSTCRTRAKRYGTSELRDECDELDVEGDGKIDFVSTTRTEWEPPEYGMKGDCTVYMRTHCTYTARVRYQTGKTCE